MNRVLELDAQSFVLLHMGERRFALPASVVAELVPLGRIHAFPHTTPRIEGVLVRRGHIIPVCDFAPILLKDRLPPRRYYLIARRHLDTGTEWTALPVTGQCELIASEMLPATGDHPPHVAGWLSHDGEVVEVLDLEQLAPRPQTVPPDEPAGAGHEELV
jgi:chemotaxis signal transduction protein